MKAIFKIFSISLLLFQINLFSQQTEKAKSEVGFWLGAANPRPGAETSNILATTLGVGLWTRFNFPYIFYTELGGGFSNYLSQTERALLTVPVYGLLCYKLPFELPVSIFFKGGGGAAYVLARPANIARWNPMSWFGTEVSFVAGRKIRIGLRIDYYTIYESYGIERNPATEFPYTSPYDRDFRLYQPNQYKIVNGEFFNFALMVSVLL